MRYQDSSICSGKREYRAIVQPSESCVMCRSKVYGGAHAASDLLQLGHGDRRQLESGFSREGLLHLFKLAIEKRMGFAGLFTQRIELGAILHQVPIYFVLM